MRPLRDTAGMETVMSIRCVGRRVALTIAGAVLCLGFAAIMARFMTETGRAPATERRPSVRRLPIALVALSAIGFCIFLSEGAIADWTAVYLKQILGAGDGLAPVGYAVFSAAMAIFRFTGDAITLRIGRAWTIR